MVKRKQYKARSLAGAENQVRMLRSRIAKDAKIFGEVYRDRGLLAKLAADGPCFFSQQEVMEAKRLRDAILRRQFNLNPDGSPCGVLHA